MGWADTVWLENGDVLSGEVVGLDAGVLKLKTVYAGELSVNWRHVRSVKTDNPLWINLIGEDRAQLRELHSSGDDLVIVDEDGYERRFSAAWPVASMAQSEPVFEDNWEFKGNVDLNLESKSGNDIESRYRMNGQMHLNDQWNKNRLKWHVDVERKDEGIWKKNIWEIEYDYSRYFTEHWFANASSKKRYHSRENLRSRATAGGFVGYRARETSSDALLNSLGLSQIWESYDREGRQQNLAVGWKLFHRRQLLSDLEYFFDSGLYYRIQSQKQWIWDGEHGVRYKMTDNLSFNVTQMFDFDSQPGEDEKKLDTQLKFGIGYNW
ncbi:hypothetical protein GZ77_11435 [Endozoicomonas montiporae]|uniref:Peptide chain release factor RF-3 n=2 Tax=Endozoicomonas montiporae TaxID=1027273 RepID=A0A081N8U9_9GAMM|nr:hypothetical protein GZ77_11435 [Endozoicomonas montiporae]